MLNRTQARAVVTMTILSLCLPLPHARAQTQSMRDCVQLKVEDHTKVVQSLQGNLGPIAALARKERLDVIARSPQTSQALLLAISKSSVLDAATNRKLDMAASCLLLASAAKVPDRSLIMIREVARELDRSSSLSGAIQQLAGARSKYADFQDIREAVSVANSVLQDGQKTIYSDKAFQTLAIASAEQPLPKAKSASEHALDLATADAKGAVNGAVGGCIAGLLAGGVGCGPGAMAGGVAAGIGNSAQELVEKAWRHGQ